MKRLDGNGDETGDSAKYSYGGKELDGGTDLYYFNARYYDATIGRFINVDPVQDGGNWYVYCENNPLKFVDPNGLETILGVDVDDIWWIGSSDETCWEGFNRNMSKVFFMFKFISFENTNTSMTSNGALVFENSSSSSIVATIADFFSNIFNAKGKSKGKSKGDKSKYRKDSNHDTLHDAIEYAKEQAGDVGNDEWINIIDEDGFFKGRIHKSGKKEWRIDLTGHSGIDKNGNSYNEPPHVNWTNWTGGKSDPNSGYGHAYFDNIY